jgi:hypothetical protein
MNDRVFHGFLQRQFEEGMALAAESDLLDLTPLGSPPSPPRRFIAHFRCTGLVRDDGGEARQANDFLVGIRFPDDYLRRCNPFEVVTWLWPREIWHPNIANDKPLICLGRLTPGKDLVYILHQLHDIIRYRKVTMVEGDSLNREACAWARRNQHLFPLDNRPLKRPAAGPPMSVSRMERAETGRQG